MRITKAIKQSNAYQYAEAVRSGDRPAGMFVRLAVDRFFKQIREAKEKGYRINHARASRAIDFFPTFLIHTKGIKAGEPFVLSDYQEFTLYNVFGWERKNSAGRWIRLYSTVYEKIARKNGKTAILAGLGLYGMAFDNELGAQIYVGATKEKQARITWEQARSFVDLSPALRSIGFKSWQTEIRFNRPGYPLAVFRYLGGDSQTLDGLDPSIAIIDEYHAHPTDGVREVLESAMGARLQPLFWIITTAGFNMASVQVQYDKVCKQILQGELEDDNTFIMIHELDPGDDWGEADNWIKANPNLNVTPSLDYLIQEYNKAKNQPSKALNFKVKHLNLQAEGQAGFIPLEVWDRNQVEQIPEDVFIQGGSCAGIDLSSTKDITAFCVMSAPDRNDIRYLVPFLFCPQDIIELRSKEDRVPYRDWARQGFIIPTPGNTVDYRYMRSVIFNQRDRLGVNRALLDKWNAHEMARELQEEDFQVEFFAQTMNNYTYPTKTFERLIYEGKIKYKFNPVMRWMLASCIVIQNSKENVMLDKGKSHVGKKRIDGIVASIMALAGTLNLNQEDNTSQYAKGKEIWM